MHLSTARARLVQFSTHIPSITARDAGLRRRCIDTREIEGTGTCAVLPRLPGLAAPIALILRASPVGFG